jgi:hypothetical protein
MSENEKAFGAHNAGLPPGWDFPEARAAAEEGLDIWMLDTALSRTPLERLRLNARLARTCKMLREAGQKKHGA